MDVQNDHNGDSFFDNTHKSADPETCSQRLLDNVESSELIAASTETQQNLDACNSDKLNRVTSPLSSGSNSSKREISLDEEDNDICSESLGNSNISGENVISSNCAASADGRLKYDLCNESIITEGERELASRYPGKPNDETSFGVSVDDIDVKKQGAIDRDNIIEDFLPTGNLSAPLVNVSQNSFVDTESQRSEYSLVDPPDDASAFNTCTKSLPDSASRKPTSWDDREDISDGELEEGLKTVSERIVDDTSVNSSDVGEIIDLKLEDASVKSRTSSCDPEDNILSKASVEDLEAVSDEEFPNVLPVPEKRTNADSLDDREEVSSSEEGEMEASSHSDKFTKSSSQVDVSNKNENLQSEPVEPPVRMESLEAEPISDEEDQQIIPREETKPAIFDDGEAGEIKSPALGSPISEQGDMMLGEVDPVSADESQDTDGEYVSGDETGKGSVKDDDKKFESIDSEDDICDDEDDKQKVEDVASGKNQSAEDSSAVTDDRRKSDASNDKEQMESISDEEMDDSFNSKNDEVSSSNKPCSPVRGSPLEKGPIQNSFNEHQLELDYEETYGEDVEGKEQKEDEAKKNDLSKESEKEEGEEEDDGKGQSSDKDEGELSDDDCEEGEIKEPGFKRPLFVRPTCRFFQRGSCTWGVNCRFIHPGINDKGNYQMIEIPGFKPVGIRARLGVGVQGPWNEPPPPEELTEIPPPPMPDIPHVETAWERGLRIAKEQRKKASERKEKEPNFDEKRLNLSVDEEKELNKENERTPQVVAPPEQHQPPPPAYYNPPAYDQRMEVNEFYKMAPEPWHPGGHFENFEVRYHRESSYSPPYSPPPYREKPLGPPMRYTRPMSPPLVDKFGRNRDARPMPPPERQEPFRVSDYPPPPSKHPDEWIDPWRRSKSPKQMSKPLRRTSRGRRDKRSVSDSSDSSRSSRSSSESSRSSRSGSGSSGSSSRSRSPEPAPPGVDRLDRPDRYGGGDQPRSTVSVRGSFEHRGGYRLDNRLPRPGRGRMYQGPGGDRNFRQDSRDGPGGYQGGYPPKNYRGGGGGGRRGGFSGPGAFNNRDPRNRDPRWGGRGEQQRGGRQASPERPLPYSRPRAKSRSSSRSSSSRSRSRSRSRSKSSVSSRSSSNSSRSSSSSSSSGSADSDNLYRDLGSPTSKQPSHRPRTGGQKKHGDPRKDRSGTKSNHGAGQPPRHTGSDRRPHSRSPTHSRGDPKYSQIPLPPSGGRGDSKYASRNAPLPPVKAKDPLKVVGQKSNIKLTLLPKQQQSSGLGDRPNPLASPPHKRRLSERDSSPPLPPPSKRPVPLQSSGLRLAAEKAAKINQRQERDRLKSPPAGSLPPSSSQRSKNPPAPLSPQKQPISKRAPAESLGNKPSAKALPAGSAPVSAQGAKAKKSMSSRREELLKQLKAVEDAIARKKVKIS